MFILSVWLGLFGLAALGFAWHEIRDSGGVEISETTRRWREHFGGSVETRRARRISAPLAIGVGCLLLLSSFVTARWSMVAVPDNIVRLEQDDPRFLRAQEEARKEISTFISQWENRASTPGHSFGIKRDFVEEFTHEHMWFAVEKIDQGVFIGTFEDYPLDISNIVFGDPVQATMDEVEDWAIWNAEGELIEGGFLSRYVE